MAAVEGAAELADTWDQLFTQGYRPVYGVDLAGTLGAEWLYPHVALRHVAPDLLAIDCVMRIRHCVAPFSIWPYLDPERASVIGLQPSWLANFGWTLAGDVRRWNAQTGFDMWWVPRRVACAAMVSLCDVAVPLTAADEVRVETFIVKYLKGLLAAGWSTAAWDEAKILLWSWLRDWRAGAWDKLTQREMAALLLQMSEFRGAGYFRSDGPRADWEGICWRAHFI